LSSKQKHKAAAKKRAGGTGAAEAKRARKHLRQVARAAARDAAEVRHELRSLRQTTEAASSDTLSAVRATADVLQTSLQQAVDDVARSRARLHEIGARIEEVGRDCNTRLAAVGALESQWESAQRDAIARIAALESEASQRVADETRAFGAQLDRMRATAVEESGRWKHEARAQAEQAVHEVEAQARAVLHRSIDRIGALVAQSEARVLDTMTPPIAPSSPPRGAGDPVPEPAPQPEPERDSIDEPTAPLVAESAPSDEIDEAWDESERDLFERLSAEFGAQDVEQEAHDEGAARAAGPLGLDDFGTLVWVVPTSPDSDADSSPGEDSDACGDTPRGHERRRETEDGPLSAAEPVFTPSPVRNGRVVASPPDLRDPVGADGTGRGMPTVITLLVPMAEAVRELAELGGDVVRVELAQRVQGLSVRPILRLSAYDTHGWWDVWDVPARTRSENVEPMVVSLPELVELVETLCSVGEAVEAELTWGALLELEGRLLEWRDPQLIPDVPEIASGAEVLDLDTTSHRGGAVEAAHGTYDVPPQLIAHLRRFGITEVEFSAGATAATLMARRPDVRDRPGWHCIAPLTERASDEEVSAKDRRRTRGEEVTQLMSVLLGDVRSEELQRILKVGAPFVRRRAAAHPALPGELAREILLSGEDTMRAAVASNPSIDSSACELAAADPAMEVRASLAANPVIPANLLEALSSDPVANVRAHAAHNPQLRGELLARLAGDEDPAVRLAVASRPDAGDEVLRTLAGDVDPEICSDVARHPDCPPDVLEELVSVAPVQVLANPGAPLGLIVAASRLDVPELRAAVASNPSTPPNVLKRLASDTDSRVLEGVAIHPKTPNGVRRRVARRLANRSGFQPEPV
jgi:hypothetical protein